MSYYSVFDCLFILIKSKCLETGIYLIKHLWDFVNYFICVLLDLQIIIRWVIDYFIVDFLIEIIGFRKVATIEMWCFTLTFLFDANYGIFLAVLLTAIFISWFEERALKLKILKKICPQGREFFISYSC